MVPSSQGPNASKRPRAQASRRHAAQEHTRGAARPWTSASRRGGSRAKTGPAVIAQYLKTLPGSPGVYRMLDAAGTVIYVGKARNLKARVTNYARAGNHTNRITRMIADTAAMEFVTVRTEAEALLLEANLIKRFRPRYNVLLRDDKSFPYILIARDHKRAADPQASRRAQPQGRLLRPVRLRRRRQPHHQHAGARVPAALLLRPRVREPHAALPAATRSSAARRPAPARSASRTTARWSRRRRASCEGESQNARADVPAADAGGGGQSRLRAGRQVPQPPVGAGARHRRPDHQPGGHRGSRRVRRLPGGRADLRPGVLLPRRPELGQPRLLPARRPLARPSRRCWRASSPSSTTTSRCRADPPQPRRAERRRCSRRRCPPRPSAGRDPRAAAGHQDRHRRARHCRTRARRSAAGWPKAPRSAPCSRAWGAASAWPSVPRRIEVFDNSHIQGANAVGAMIVAGPEGFVKNQYRKFNIKSADLAPGDDYAMMREVLTRRFKRLVLDEAEAPAAEVSDPPGLTAVAATPSQPSSLGVRPGGSDTDVTRITHRAAAARRPSTSAAAARWPSACCAPMPTPRCRRRARGDRSGRGGDSQEPTTASDEFPDAARPRADRRRPRASSASPARCWPTSASPASR